MKKSLLVILVGTALLSSLYVGAASALPTWGNNPKAFIHGIALDIEGETWYFVGPGSVPGVVDVPGHTWVQTGPYRVVGKHYNIGPNGAPSWWAVNEESGIQLYKVDGIIDVKPNMLSSERAEWLLEHGYVHVHELVNAMNEEHPYYMVYLKHTAITEFDFNGMPAQMMGNIHHVTPGIDYNFMPNWRHIDIIIG